MYLFEKNILPPLKNLDQPFPKKTETLKEKQKIKALASLFLVSLKGLFFACRENGSLFSADVEKGRPVPQQTIALREKLLEIWDSKDTKILMSGWMGAILILIYSRSHRFKETLS